MFSCLISFSAPVPLRFQEGDPRYAMTMIREIARARAATAYDALHYLPRYTA